MYDIVIVNNSNKIKIILLVAILILIVFLATIVGMYIATKKLNIEYSEQLIKQAKIEQEKAEQQKLKIKQQIINEIQQRIDKTSVPLTEQQQYNILHIYNSIEKKRVFLTFDDGPSSLVTPLILDVLKQENVKATFFILGERASRNKELIKREFYEGHYIANHGYSHKYSNIYSSPEATLEEYNKTEQIIRDALDNQSYRCNVFRFPGGSNGGIYNAKKQESKAYLKENGIVHLDWNALSEDAAGSYTKEQLLENVKNTMSGHDSVVILMHDASDKILTYEMLTDLIHYLKNEGFIFQNIYDLL